MKHKQIHQQSSRFSPPRRRQQLREAVFVKISQVNMPKAHPSITSKQNKAVGKNRW